MKRLIYAAAVLALMALACSFGGYTISPSADQPGQPPIAAQENPAGQPQVEQPEPQQPAQPDEPAEQASEKPPAEVEEKPLEPRVLYFYACLDECENNGSNHRRTFGEAITKVFFEYRYEDFPAGAAYTRTWTKDGEMWAEYECDWSGPEDGIDEITLTEPYGLASGYWEVTITVNNQEVLKDGLWVEGQHDYWDPAGYFDACYGKTSSAPPAPQFSGTTDVIIKNNGILSIWYVYISPSSETKFGPNLLGINNIQPGDSYLFNVPSGIYDILLVNSDNEEVVFWYVILDGKPTIFEFP